MEPPWGNPKPPEQEDEIGLRGLIDLEVVYPADNRESIDIPDEWVTPVVVVLSKNLETALELETEIDKDGLGGEIGPIVPDNNSIDDPYELSGAVIEFASVFERLIQIDLKAARREFSKWPIEDDAIFTRLRIWAAGKPELISDDQFGPMLADMSDDAFWDGSHAWDLLHTLLTRWDGLSDATRVEIEERLLKGRSRRDQETEEDFRKYSAWSILARITWLSQKGCNLNLDLEEETDRLQEFVPDWNPEYADEIVAHSRVQGGLVETEIDHSALLGIPLASVISTARSLSGRRIRGDLFVEYKPFVGLSNACPVRAFSALRVVADEGDFPSWAWNQFLYADKRKTDKPRFMLLIAERLVGYLDNGKTELAGPAAGWLENVSGRLADESSASFHRVTSALIRALRRGPESGVSETRQVDGIQDWANTALNAPAGKIAQSVLYGAQQTDFLEYADKLLALPGDLRRHVLAIFARWTDWFYRVNREWSENNLLSVFDANDPEDRDAFWGGFFLRPKVNQELFMRLKPHLLQLAREGRVTRRSQGLSSLILSGWGSIIEGTSDRCISNEEFRTILVQTDDKFRSYALWHLEKRSCDENEETKNKWTSWLPEFLKDVWPYQEKANSPAVSESLCHLAFSNEELFPELIEIILPRLAKIDGHDLWFKARDFVKEYPRQTLDLLDAALSDNVSSWSYYVGDILASINEVDPTLRTNEKFLELKRRWDSR